MLAPTLSRRGGGRHDRRFVPGLGVEALEPLVLMSAAVVEGPAVVEDRIAALAADTAAAANRRYVARISTTLVDRPLSADVQAGLVRLLDRGVSREQVAAFVLRTPEGRQAEIRTTYLKLLRREPLAGEMRSALANGRRGGDQLAVIARVVGSDEYYRKQGGTATGYVDALAADLLRRVPTAAEADRWLGELARGASRAQLAASLLKSPAYAAAVSAQLSGHAAPGQGSSSLADSIRSAWQSPQALTRAKARAYGSDEYLANLLTPRPPVAPTPSSPLPPISLPLTPRFSLTTGWSAIAPINVGYLNLLGIGASPQGKYWFGTDNHGVVLYDPAAVTTTPVSSLYASSIAPISDSQAWIVGSTAAHEAPLFIGRLDAQGALTTIAGLPAGDTPTQVAAAPDGTVWALGQSGAAYAYQSGSQVWATLSMNGFTIQQLSIGSSGDIWAIGRSQGQAQVLRWSNGGWTVDDYFKGVTPTQVAATSDQAVWAVADGYVFSKLAGGDWQLVKNQTAPGTILAMAANDRNRMVAVNEATSSLNVLSVGVVDRPAVAFPEVSSQWARGYAAINQAFGITVDRGIRALYNDTTGDFQTWLTDLQTGRVPAPLGVSPENWGAITGQIEGELNDAIGVNKFFAQLNNLNLAVAQVNSNSLTVANGLVGLTPQQQGGDKLGLFIEALFEAGLAGLATTVSGGAAAAAAFMASGVDSLIADLTGDPNPSPQTKLETTYTTLLTQLTKLFLDNGTNYGLQQTKIVQDYGMLSAVGDAVNTGLWAWDDTTGSTLARDATDGFSLYFYKALMPLNWQIIYLPGYICDLYNCPDIDSADYATYTVVLEQSKTFLSENIYFVDQLGSSTDPYHNSGPYPTKDLMTAIFALGVTDDDFYNNKNGWALKSITAS